MLLFVAGKGRDFFLSFQENSLFKCTMFFFDFRTPPNGLFWIQFHHPQFGLFPFEVEQWLTATCENSILKKMQLYSCFMVFKQQAQCTIEWAIG